MSSLQLYSRKTQKRQAHQGGDEHRNAQPLQRRGNIGVAQPLADARQQDNGQKKADTRAKGKNGGFGHIVPVSYTHLDVYKRQGVPRVRVDSVAEFMSVALHKLAVAARRRERLVIQRYHRL